MGHIVHWGEEGAVKFGGDMLDGPFRMRVSSCDATNVLPVPVWSLQLQYNDIFEQMDFSILACLHPYKEDEQPTYVLWSITLSLFDVFAQCVTLTYTFCLPLENIMLRPAPIAV